MSRDSWRQMAFADAVDINPKRAVKAGSVIPYVEMAAVPSSGATIEYLREREAGGGGAKFKNGDTLFARITPCAENGKTAFVDCLRPGEIGLGSTELIVFGPKTNLTDPAYVYHLARSELVRGPAISQMVGTTGRARVPNTVFQEITIAVPPLNEQRRIAEILSSVDDAIAATRAVIEQSRKVKQGVLERLLTKGIGHTRFKQTEIGEIPEGWPLMTAEDVCIQISVGIVIKPSQYYAESGIRCFRSANVREGFVEDADWVYITKEGNRLNRKSVLRTGDVLVVRTGYPGTSCVVPPRYDGANCIDIILARTKSEMIDPFFLSTFINSASGKTQVLKAEGGLAQKHFNVGAMKQMKLPLPSLNEQRGIVQHIRELASAEAALEHTLQQKIRFKSALMSDLLTGRKRVTNTLPMAAE